jgi:hypothetical protein
MIDFIITTFLVLTPQFSMDGENQGTETSQGLFPNTERIEPGFGNGPWGEAYISPSFPE